MKTALSLPDSLFHEAEAAAQRLSVSRSLLYAAALREFLSNHRNDNVTEKLNEIYSQQSSALDPVTDELQSRSIGAEEW